MSTIYALSTLMGKSGVAVIRLSGQKAKDVLPLLGMQNDLSPNICSYAEIYDPSTMEQIDQCMVTYFKAPRSFTGEDVVEFYTHGSVAVIEHLLEVLSNFKFLRMAEPGEFAKRAFLNSKLDLTKAEGLADLIDAETRVQKKIALNQLNGSLENVYNGWRADIISILARLEALIDFPEDDIPEGVIEEITSIVSNMVSQITKHLSNKTGEVVKRGLRVAIIGEPNAGKSTLLNALAKSEIAIVSEISGTTRDVINVKIDLNGYPLQLYDTAGIRETQDLIEKEGIGRALKTAQDADLVLLLVDGSDPNFNPQDFVAKHNLSGNIEIIVNKIDLIAHSKSDQYLYISAKNGENIDSVLSLLNSFVIENYSISSEPLITKSRYRNLLTRTVDLLNRFDPNSQLEISAEIARQAAIELGHITGKVDVEEVLDNIFSTFCIGK